MTKSGVWFVLFLCHQLCRTVSVVILSLTVSVVWPTALSRFCPSNYLKQCWNTSLADLWPNGTCMGDCASFYLTFLKRYFPPSWSLHILPNFHVHRINLLLKTRVRVRLGSMTRDSSPSFKVSWISLKNLGI